MIDTWQKLPYGFSQSMANQKKKKSHEKIVNDKMNSLSNTLYGLSKI